MLKSTPSASFFLLLISWVCRSVILQDNSGRGEAMKMLEELSAVLQCDEKRVVDKVRVAAWSCMRLLVFAFFPTLTIPFL